MWYPEHPSFAAIRLPSFDALFEAVATQAKTSKDREHEDGAFLISHDYTEIGLSSKGVSTAPVASNVLR
jgi:hypothetical protein